MSALGPARQASGLRESESYGERRQSLRPRIRAVARRVAMVGEKTGDAMVGEKTGAWTGKKKTKVQRAPTSEGVDMTAPVISTEPAGRRLFVPGFDLKLFEAIGSTMADVKEGIDRLDCCISLHGGIGDKFWEILDDLGFGWIMADAEEINLFDIGLPGRGDKFWEIFGCLGLPGRGRGDKFWEILDDQKTEEVYKRLAICHIRAHKGAELNDEQLLAMLEKDGPFKPYDQRSMWHFDKYRCKVAGFQDYQRLILRNNGFLDGCCYNEACSTLESDQQFVHLWEKLLDKAKWLQHYHKLTLRERNIMDRVTYYHAMKIVSTDCLRIYATILDPLLMDFTYSVTNDHFYARVYFEVWKRVAKQKMDLKDALDEVKDEAMWNFDWRAVKAELGTDNYKTCVAGIDNDHEEGEAYWLIVEAVRNIDPLQLRRLMTYYEFAKKKLDIADKMGLIGSTPHASFT